MKSLNPTPEQIYRNHLKHRFTVYNKNRVLRGERKITFCEFLQKVLLNNWLKKESKNFDRLDYYKEKATYKNNSST